MSASGRLRLSQFDPYQPFKQLGSMSAVQRSATVAD